MRHVTCGGKASVKLPQFQAVKTVPSNVMTAMVSTYHAVKFEKYAHRRLAEVQYGSTVGTICSRSGSGWCRIKATLRAADPCLCSSGRLI